MRRLIFSTFLLALVPGLCLGAMRSWPASPRRGDIVRVLFTGDYSPDAPPRILFEGVAYPAWPVTGGWEGFVAVDRDDKPGKKRVALAREDGAPPLEEAALDVENRKFAEQRLAVEERMVTLSRADQERADRERETIAKALSATTPDKFWRSAFVRPVEGPESSPFGLKRFYNGKARNYHGGVDLAAPRGAPVAPASEGVVLLAGDFFYTGNSVFVDHGLGLVTAYFHMDDLMVAVGERVGTGSVLGHVGATGRSTGPHLHWSAYLLSRKADPDALIRATAGEGAAKNP